MDIGDKKVESDQQKNHHTNGFVFIEFVTDQPKKLSDLFQSMGFQKSGMTSDQNKHLYSQGNIHFIINTEQSGNAAAYQKQHIEGVSAIAFIVNNTQFCYDNALSKGAVKAQSSDYSIPGIKGIGGGILYLISDEEFQNFLTTTFNSDQYKSSYNENNNVGLLEIDHLTHNVAQGEMEVWAQFYQRVFDFQTIRSFNIKGAKTGLHSIALKSPCGKIKIPINESSDKQSQIQEFLTLNNGEGVQHIALTSNDIYYSIGTLKSLNVPFQSTPDTYYERLEHRLPQHGEKTESLKALGILLDRGNNPSEGKLLQIFTKEIIGPLFFEIIQRKGNDGFGEGNFQALFESIELDQMRRGVIQ